MLKSVYYVNCTCPSRLRNRGRPNARQTTIEMILPPGEEEGATVYVPVYMYVTV